VEIIPVIDLMHGIVVRGIGGRRDEYQPIVSKIVDSPRPLDVARAIRDHFGLERFYIADLDGLMGEIPHWETFGWLIADGFQLDIDMGVRDLDQARRLLRRGAAHLILSLESFPDPEDLPRWVAQLDPEKILFSLDLKAGAPITPSTNWPSDPLQIANLVANAGITQMIVLDLAHVGSNSGLGTLSLCRDIAQAHPNLSLITGGGIRSGHDLQSLHAEPLAGLLVASALHDGRITASDIRLFASSESGESPIPPKPSIDLPSP